MINIRLNKTIGKSLARRDGLLVPRGQALQVVAKACKRGQGDQFKVGRVASVCGRGWLAGHVESRQGHS